MLSSVPPVPHSRLDQFPWGGGRGGQWGGGGDLSSGLSKEAVFVFIQPSGHIFVFCFINLFLFCLPSFLLSLHFYSAVLNLTSPPEYLAHKFTTFLLLQCNYLKLKGLL